MRRAIRPLVRPRPLVRATTLPARVNTPRTLARAAAARLTVHITFVLPLAALHVTTHPRPAGAAAPVPPGPPGAPVAPAGPVAPVAPVPPAGPGGPAGPVWPAGGT